MLLVSGMNKERGLEDGWGGGKGTNSKDQGLGKQPSWTRKELRHQLEVEAGF